MWNGAVGMSWNADRKTVNVNPHIRKKRGVKRCAFSADIEVFSLSSGNLGSRRR